MPFTEQQVLDMVQAYYWPFLRVSAMMMAAPVFGASSFPVRARIILAVLVAAVIAPVLPSYPQVDPLSAVGVLTAGQQILIGLAMGFIMQMAFSALVIAGQTLAMTMGLGFAMSVDPQNGVQVPVLSQLYVILATLFFLAIDGHLLMLAFISDSFSLLPPGLADWHWDLAINIVLWASQMFASALLLALPALTAVLLINVSFGVITRAAPQLNIFAVGFPVTILVGFVFVFLSMPALVSLLQDLFDMNLSAASRLFR